ncbi:MULTISPECIES: hypothetical protein [Kitasatospora]|uniref:Uncharacterized protein n=1 Tax=Kitasatospora setae (strain ATCC 33774 / DSM 43861 / JCM 3304 / KCC A-0304 / NBRC 14216 / KM-6054) TaxID=452652 RepID=E4N2G8_KITSK|nr:MULTISPECIES: hypothetical protein [Kitasatospora]BAJ32352.1 hypothetical protein KSE_65930 [Kitasatospora setae KM-6054]
MAEPTGRPGELSLTALAVAADPDPAPLYRPTGPLTGHRPDTRLLAALAARLRGPDAGAPLAAAPDRAHLADLAAAALAALGPVPDGTGLLLVQPGHDTDHDAFPLPRLVHDAPWRVGEDLALSHPEDSGGLDVFDLLRWWLPPGGRTALVLADRPEFAGRDGAPPTGTVLALLVTAGPGTLTVLPGPVDGPALRCAAPTAAVAWLALARALADGALPPGGTAELAVPTAARTARLALRADGVLRPRTVTVERSAP